MLDEVEAPSIPMDKLVAAYIKLRDKRLELKGAFEESDKNFEEQMDLISQHMLDVCKETGATSIKTEYGTIIRSIKSKYWTNDWDSMYKFIEENNAFGLLEKRLHQTNMKSFILENPDLLPMGLNVESEYSITVRRSKENLK